ncbi:MAG: hypothetical protein AAF587_22565 [Bacteroidota bacterium]
MKSFIRLLITLCVASFFFSAPTVKAQDNGGEITILFAYTTSAAISAGSVKNLKRNIDGGMLLLNDALANNFFPYSISAVAEYVEVEYGAVPSKNDVHNLLTELDKTDGKFNKIHQFRQQKKADIVCLVFSGYTMGQANLNGDMMVCHYKAFDKSYVFPHEFGHIMGATHEAGMLITVNGTSYRTITNNQGVAIPYFSTNDEYDIEVDGNTEFVRLGDASHDNLATMAKNAPSKSQLGEKLSSVASSSSAATAKLVNPMTAKTPAGKAPFSVSSFVVASDGKMTIKYDTSDAVEFSVEGFDGNKSFGGFKGNLDPSKKEMVVQHWSSTYSKDKYILSIKGKQLKSYTMP